MPKLINLQNKNKTMKYIVKEKIMNETKEEQQQQEDVFELSRYGIPHERCREQHINSLIKQEIDMSLDVASDLAFKLLKDTNVNDDDLEMLKHYFIQAKASLDCYEYAFHKLEKRNEKLEYFYEEYSDLDREVKDLDREVKRKVPSWVVNNKGKSNLN